MLDKNKLEEILVANWANFIDTRRLIALVFSCVRDAELRVTSDKCPVKDRKSMIANVSLSRFKLGHDNAEVWADFIVPRQDGIAVGTVELRADLSDGSFSVIQTLGSLFTNHTNR